MKLITNQPITEDQLEPTQVLILANDVDPCKLALDGIARIELNFPKFTDGRAFSQSFLLRRRLGFSGELRAVGDVLIDQLLQMKRSGFDSAVLRADQNPDFAHRQLARYPAFYQGDAGSAAPRFAQHEQPTSDDQLRTELKVCPAKYQEAHA
ncbi:DUF934 domain-containing protein [Rhodoferax sp.]|uniref:DUF934 domain-containing protein n=1 Tax=Rhodoferax sp. TaxID=50421 RepID=UPI00277529CA|nr:DUF934 domain-containing protein [Rhodoferax sp.]